MDKETIMNELDFWKVEASKLETHLRDQFAMAALTGRLALDAHPQSGGPSLPREVAEYAYRAADAMLKERGEER